MSDELPVRVESARAHVHPSDRGLAHRTIPEGRYGPPAVRRQRVKFLVIMVSAVLGLAVAVWVALAFARQDVRWKDVGFHVAGPESVTVTFEVYMKAGSVADCTVHALATSYAEVGVMTVRVGPVETLDSQYTVTLRTSELATTGVVDRCVLVSSP